VSWPKVLGEFETIDRLLDGWSLQRHGDGELKVMHGAGYSREPANADLTTALLAAFQSPAPRCLVGIPTMAPAGPKYENWTRHQARFELLLVEGREYASAFVSRPDSAPWINCRAYAQTVEMLWAGKRAVVVCEKGGSMIRTVSRRAARALHVSCPHREAFRSIDLLEANVLAREPQVVILCAGPTASVLANRLAAQGVHAIDLGSSGQFLGKALADATR
jgi:hypothetical protein